MNNLYFTKVEYVEDSQAGLRIKVRIPSVDLYDDPLNEDWPWAFPLLPKHLHINPKVGECVLVILEAPQQKFGGRYSRQTASDHCSLPAWSVFDVP